jgi:hypothetical protein
MTVINAFHPDYMKTHEPNFMKDLRTNQANREQSAKQSKVIDRERAAGKSPGTIHHMGSGKTGTILPAHMHRKAPKKLEIIKLTVREFHTYAKAGMPKKKEAP